MRPPAEPQATIEEQPKHLPSPPSDAEVYTYLGSQNRLVQLAMTGAFVLAAVSLTRFSLMSPWLYPLLAILAVSVIGSVLSMISGLNKRRVSKKSHQELITHWAATHPPQEFPTVDVYLPCCGEDLDILRNTYTHVSKMEWGGELNVWVLDDGDMPAVAELAREFGFHYIVRANRGVLKKAGNLRNAYDTTWGEFIVIFDADFSPRHDFLLHSMPYMDDRRIGIVQTPQYFDSKPAMSWLERTAGATQELFYRWVQPSRDRAGAPICVGTCAVYRRKALERAGGFAQIEHSEDVHTGIALIRAGFVTRYVPVVVSRGLCPSDLRGFLNQQYRWCNGSITLMRSGEAQQRPLTLWQRICFWAGFMYYVSTALNVFAVHIPGLVMAVFFASEIRAVHYVPFLAGAWVYFVLLPVVSRSTWRFEVLRVQMAYSFCHAVALAHKLTGRTAGWVPTGAVGKKNNLARTIAIVGSVTLTLLIGASWTAFVVDVRQFGWQNFWPMAVFLAGYTYLAAPLVWGFIQVMFPSYFASTRLRLSSRAIMSAVETSGLAPQRELRGSGA
ncbi:glycosyltransferase family 2 protein [Glaciihabitans sp. dw_435]|uniref:glycosyltransferase family 2 protein n=1 Tax=Glaciihabitans sp. dw_435 TaxID=2720081 RepID=UPI001BD6DC27|nr:cellulose synthase catalytic subunit [Glaciihabitans sp. dw_435]